MFNKALEYLTGGSEKVKSWEKLNLLSNALEVGLNCVLGEFDKIYVYKGLKKNGITQGGRSSCLISDIIMQALYKKLYEKIDKKQVFFCKTFRDDGLWLCDKDYHETLVRLMAEANEELFGLDKFKFTTETNLKQVDFLDVNLLINKENELDFKIYTKPNQKIKYINKASYHYQSHIQNVLKGTITRLLSLSSGVYKLKSVDEIFEYEWRSILLL